MAETLEPGTDEVDQQQRAEQLLAQIKEQGVDLVGPNGLLNQLTENVLETALDAELTEHLGYANTTPPVGTGQFAQQHPVQDGAHRDWPGRDRSAA